MTDPLVELRAHAPAIVAIGASAGAIEVLLEVLPRLHADFPCPIVIVVHIPPDRRSALPSLLASASCLPVREAEAGLRLEPGVVCLGASDYHLLVERDGTVSLSIDDPVHYSRPAIDVLFESVAYAFGPRAMGILLSGASTDGAQGLARLHARGALTWVQSPESSRVPLMPEAALRLAPHRVLAPPVMAATLGEWRQEHA